MDQHVKTVVRSCFFHLRRLKSVRRILGREVTLGLVSAFVATRLDYCNSVLAELPRATIDPLQRVQNAAARLVAGIRTRDHITPVLRSLHWLPIRLRIQYKLCVLMYLVRVGRSPAYLADMMTATADLLGRETPFCQQFPIRNPKTETQVWWAGLLIRWTGGVELTSFQSPWTNEHWYFKKQLKTRLLELAYEWQIWLCWCTTGHRRCEIM